MNFEPQSKYGILGIVHDVSVVEKDIYYKYIEQNRIFGLTKKQCEEYGLLMLNPNYFGGRTINNSVNKICKFTIIGSAFDEKRIEEAVDFLIQKNISGFMINWVSGQYSKGYVVINKIVKLIIYFTLGLFNKKMHRKFEIIKHIRWFSRLNFKEIYNLVESTDYCICMVENENTEYSKYYNKLTSGQKQLTLGFCKVTLWEEKLANIYGFSENNSIIIRDENIGESMLEAMTLSCEGKKNKQESLCNLQSEIEKESLCNLKTVINEICNK